MHIKFSLLRDGITSTSVYLNMEQLSLVHRWIASSLRGSGVDSSKYHLVAYGDLQDISGTDILEEITGTVTGTSYKIVNKRELSDSHMEFDLEPINHG